MMIDWSKASRDDVLTINRIAKRALAIDHRLDLLQLQMDLEGCHVSGCQLDLTRMESGANADLMHDVYGIRRHIDRDTGELCDNFLPRFAACVTV